VKPSDVLKLEAKEVREKSPAELVKLVGELEEELFRLRFRKGAGQLKQTTNIRHAKRCLARVKTVLREQSQAKGGA
jgi:large subunit ribosomal protein L29